MKLYNDSFPKFEDALISGGKQALQIQLQSSDSASCKIDGIEARVLLQVSSNEYNEQAEFRVLVCDLDTEIHRGSIISDILREGFETDNLGDWMVISDVDVNQISKNCKVQKCNQTLSFQLNSVIYNYPCVFESSISKNSDGTTTNRIFSENSDVAVVTIQNNATTSQLVEKSRYIFNHKKSNVYETTSINDIESPGLLYIQMRHGQYSDVDNLELNVANYYDTIANKEVHILNGETADLLYTNQTLQLSIECKENGVIVNSPTVTYSSSDSYVCTVSSTGLITARGTGVATVTVNYGDAHDTISINSVMVVSNNYDIVLTPTDVTLVKNRTLTLTANVRNNGIADNFRVVSWTVTNVDGTVNEYVTYASDLHTITLTAGNIYGKSVMVKATLDIDSNITAERTIKIINLI